MPVFRVLAVAFLVLSSALHAQERSAAPDPAHDLAGEALVRALRAGGLTLYFRHTATDFSQNDANMGTYEDCAKQRNLSETGRGQAREVRRAIEKLRLPVDEVLASPFCRTMETGRLMFGRATPSSHVRGWEGPRGTPDYSRLEKILATPPRAGTLRAIAGHGNPFRAIAGPPHLEEGEAAVVRGLGDRWVVVARIRVKDWPTLEAAAAK